VAVEDVEVVDEADLTVETETGQRVREEMELMERKELEMVVRTEDREGGKTYAHWPLVKYSLVTMFYMFCMFCGSSFKFTQHILYI